MENDAQNEDFTRELEVESNKKLFTLQLKQKCVGDVGCVVWDAAIVLVKYLEYETSKKGIVSCENTETYCFSY